MANSRWLLTLITAARGAEDDCRRYASLVFAHVGPGSTSVLALLTTGALGLLELGLGRPEQAIVHLEQASVWGGYSRLKRTRTPDGERSGGWVRGRGGPTGASPDLASRIGQQDLMG